MTEPLANEPASCATSELVSEKDPPVIAQLEFDPSGQFESAWGTTLAFQTAVSPPEPLLHP